MIARYLTYAAVGIGLLGFFLPLMATKQQGIEVSLSSFTLVTGAEAAFESAIEQGAEQLGTSKDALKGADPKTLERAKAAATAGFQKFADALKLFVLIIFAPTILFIFIALLGRKRFGRGLGVFALIVGIIGLLGWMLLNAAFSESAAESAREVSTGFGFTLLLLSALAGFAAGVMGIAKPEPKEA